MHDSNLVEELRTRLRASLAQILMPSAKHRKMSMGLLARELVPPVGLEPTLEGF